MRMRSFLVLGAAGFCVIVGGACREPTQITLQITTTARCQGATVYPQLVGVAIDQASTSIQTSQCTPTSTGGDVGSITVIPGSSGASGLVKIKVAGLIKSSATTQTTTTDVSACTSGNPECIVATRTLAFVDHSPLKLPIVLDALCAGFPCADGKTCEVVDRAPRCVGDCKQAECGGGDAGVVDAGDPVDAGSPPVSLDATDIVTGHGSTCALLTSGEWVCWGSNAKDKLFAGPDPKPPTVVKELADSPIVAFGDRHGCRVTTAKSGQVECWGANDLLQRGVASSTTPINSVQLGGLGSVSALAAGRNFTCALFKPKVALGDPQAWCWGDDGQGQSSGTGLQGKTAAPTQVPGGNGIALAVGDDFACSLIGEGGPCALNCKAATCWGVNDRSQCGTTAGKTGAAGALSFPATFGPAQQLAAGGAYSLLAFGNNVQGWGDNTKLLISALQPQASLTPVASDRAPAPFALGASYGCALSKNVTCWGDGPVMKADLSVLKLAPKKLVGGEDYVCALVEGGKVFCWGDDARGQLGAPNLGPNPVEIKYQP